jgi:hypothetical protein
VKISHRVLAAAALLLCVFGPAQADEFQERRQKMIQDCMDNHGYEIDCKREVDTELRAEGLQFGARVIHLSPPR